LTEHTVRYGGLDRKVETHGQSSQISVFLTFLDRAGMDLRLE